MPLDTDLNEWNEIDKEEAERIKKAKEAAKGSVDYPEEKVNQMIGVFVASINKMDLTLTIGAERYTSTTNITITSY